jgi:outer membrane protein assembly factor BamB
MTRTLPILPASLGFLLCVAIASADDWPCYRGPNHNGISAEKGWRDTWPESGPPVLWKANVGTGFSSLAVSKGRVLTVGNKDDRDTVYCFDAEKGTKLWTHSYEADLGAKFFDGGPGATPTVDGDAVYTLSRWGDLFCLDLATGKVRWKKNLEKDEGMPLPSWGFAGSPVVHGKLLLLNVGQGGMALDKATGKVRWKSEAREPGYSTPVPFRRDGKWYAAFSSGRSYLAAGLDTGKVLWEHTWITRFGVNAADPLLRGEEVLISSGYGKGAALLNTADGKAKEVWRNKDLRNQFNSSVRIEGHVYGIDGDTTARASLVCLEWKTGKVLWRRKNVGSGGLMAADGKLIVLSDRGELMVGPASPKGFTPTARAQVLEGTCWITPVLANGRIYCRNSDGDVVCLDVRRK